MDQVHSTSAQEELAARIENLKSEVRTELGGQVVSESAVAILVRQVKGKGS
jgi:hypothetical protein